MAQSIQIAGASYPDVPSIVVPKVGSGTAIFADPSGTTATASDVAQGKYFLTDQGVLTQGTASGGGGSTTLKFGVLRPDATVVKTWSWDKWVVADEGLTIPAYSTAKTTFHASAALSDTYTINPVNYTYAVLYRVLAYPTYSISTKGKGRFEYSMMSRFIEIKNVPENTLHSLVDTTKYAAASAASVTAQNSFATGAYWSGSSTFTSTTSSNLGTYIDIPTTPVSISSNVVTITSPLMGVGGSASYLTSTYMNAITDIRYQYIIELYRSTRANSNVDGFNAASQLYHIIDCVNSANHTLT